MEIHLLSYGQLSESEMAAANRSETLQECQAHLDRAMGYAQLAWRERQWHRALNANSDERLRQQES
jgi:hypothetical protein